MQNLHCLLGLVGGSFHRGPLTTEPGKGNIFVFAKPALLGEPEEQVGATLYFHLYLQLSIFVFLQLFIFVFFARSAPLSRRTEGTSGCNYWKDCLLTGQEQACTRITWLFVCLFGCHQAENGPIHRKMAVHRALMITSKGETLFETSPQPGMRQNWSSQSFA